MKKEEKENPLEPQKGVPGGGGVDDPKCDKTVPTDPHYGEAGDYDENCRWIPDNGK